MVLRLITYKELFVDVMYERLIGVIQMIEHDMFDLSGYQYMFQKAEECKYEDETIGII